MKHKRKRNYLLPAVLIIAALILVSYPFISNMLQEQSADSIVSALDKEAEDMEDEDLQDKIEAARRYNEKLTEVRSSLIDPFNETTSEDSEYEELLCMTDDGIMGYIDIPSIDITLPIYHGTSSAVLEKGVGHLEGTSLPVGGESTHSVLTGHTGLSNARLFSDLTELEEGDVFILSIMGEKLAYEVDQIKVVEPDNLDDLYVIDGEDHCTLLTCTPYGINSHRLLVRGTRTDYEEAMADESNFEKKEEQSAWMQEYMGSLILSFAVFMIFLILFLIVKKIRDRADKKKQNKVQTNDKDSSDSS